MGYDVVGRLPSLEELLDKYPLSDNDLNSILINRQEIKQIITNNDNRILIIVGPCSAWPYDACIEYAYKLKLLQEKIKNKIKLVMRVYTQKPRTATGWLGIANQPNPFLEPNIYKGIHLARKLMTEIIKIGVAVADEALFINNMSRLVDLVSWVAIGARSSENQEHRIYASSLDCAVGIKNPTSGSVMVGLNGVMVSQRSHYYAYNDSAIKTHGNNFAHLVLRGGNGIANYSMSNLEFLSDYFQNNVIHNPGYIIDVSHDNCIINGKKKYEQQGFIMLEIMKMLNENYEIKKYFKGFMLESFIKSGNQLLKNSSNIDLGGLSITDPCIDFMATEDVLFKLMELI
jgi:3-deoxy-7-phosphoheptulonate synthase